MDRWTDGRTDGGMDGWMDDCILLSLARGNIQRRNSSNTSDFDTPFLL